jgi:hypothetical protein
MIIKISNSCGRVKDLFIVHLTIFPIYQIIQHQMKITRKEAIQIKNETSIQWPTTHEHEARRGEAEANYLLPACLYKCKGKVLIYDLFNWTNSGFTALDGTLICKE